MELLSSIFSKITIKLLNFSCYSQFWLSILLWRKWNITKIKEENGKFKMCNIFNMRNLLTIWLKLLTLFLARISSTNLVNLMTTLKVKEILFNQFSRSVVSDSLRPHESQHARPPCHHQLPEFTPTHVHQVSDAIQPSHPLSSPSPPAPNPSQHQGLFQWVNSSHELAKVLEFQL